MYELLNEAKAEYFAAADVAAAAFEEYMAAPFDWHIDEREATLEAVWREMFERRGAFYGNLRVGRSRRIRWRRA